MDTRSPRVAAHLILSAVPDLRDRLLEHRIRRAWSDVVGADAARRAQPKSFAEGCLTVAVDNSPWLHELTLRSEELTRRLNARFDAVRSLRFVAGRIEPASTVRADPQRPAPLDAGARREIDQGAGAIRGPTLADAARRLMTKAWPGLSAFLAVTVLSGCAVAGGPTFSGDDQVPRRSAAADPQADAYYAYSVAQMHIQAGRFKDAVPLMRAALKRDPNSAALWTQYAQLLVRVDNVDEAVSAARRAVELAPDQVNARMTLAELLRTQRKFPEAETELERAIALSPDSEE